MKYLLLLDTVICNLLGDLKSFRTWLILAAFGFNIYLIKVNKSDTVLLAGISLLTGIYGMYFYSKHQQAKQDAAKAD